MPFQFGAVRIRFPAYFTDIFSILLFMFQVLFVTAAMDHLNMATKVQLLLKFLMADLTNQLV